MLSALDPKRYDGDVDGSYERKKKLLWLLRFWLLHSVGSVHSYLMGQVLLSLGLQLEQDLEAACDLDTLIKGKCQNTNFVSFIFNSKLKKLY